MTSSSDKATYISASYRFGSQATTTTSANVIWPVTGKIGPDYININSPQYVVGVAQGATDAASSTGARAIVLQGLSGSLTLQQEQIWLNGTSPVTTSNQYVRVFRAWATKCGSNGTNASSVFVGYGTITSGVPASILCQISAGRGQTTQINQTVATSIVTHLHDMTFAIGRTGGGQDVLGTFTLRTRQITGVYGSYELGPWRDRIVADTISTFNYQASEDEIIFYGPYDFEGRVLASGAARATCVIGGEFHKYIGNAVEFP